MVRTKKRSPEGLPTRVADPALFNQVNKEIIFVQMYVRISNYPASESVEPGLQHQHSFQKHRHLTGTIKKESGA